VENSRAPLPAVVSLELTPSGKTSVATSDLIELLYAARGVARHQFTRSEPGIFTPPVHRCVECRRLQTAGSLDNHPAECGTGRLVRVLGRMLGQEGPQLLANPTSERSLREEIRNGNGGGAGRFAHSRPEAVEMERSASR
jgi:hypothetical protein